MDIPVIADGTPDVEHAFMLLLLLVGLLSIEGKQRRYIPWIILAGIVIALFTPVHAIEPAWPILTAIVVPPLMWHISLRLASARAMWAWKRSLSWLLIASVFGAGLYLSGSQGAGSTLLLSAVAASLVWHVRESTADKTYLSILGLLVVALLLAEVDLTLHTIGTWFGTLLSGAGFGMVLGIVSVAIARKLHSSEAKNLSFLAAAYVAYLIGAALGISGITLTLMTGLVAANYGLHTGIWTNTNSLPSPLNRGVVFWVLAAAWLLLSWQAHVPLTGTRIAGIGISLLSITAGILVARWAAPPDADEANSPLHRLWMKERVILLLVGGKLLLWPPEITIEPSVVIVAVASSLLIIAILRYGLHPFFDFVGIKLNSTANPSTE